MRRPLLERQWRMVGGLAVHARVAERVPSWFPAIILVHGVGVSSRYMCALARELAPFYRVFAIDLPGFGRSERPPRPLGLIELAEALATWMRTTGLRSATVVGNSFGAQIGVELAARRPRLVERLVLISPTTDPAYRTRRQQLLRLLLDGVREPISLVALVVGDYLRCGPRFALNALAEALRHPLETRLSSVVAPALVMRGMRDPLVGAAWAERVASELPAGRLVVLPGVAHAAHYAAPRSVARTIRRFVDEQPASRVAVA